MTLFLVFAYHTRCQECGFGCELIRVFAKKSDADEFVVEMSGTNIIYFVKKCEIGEEITEFNFAQLDAAYNANYSC